MPKLTTIQAAHTYGVLDPHVVERRDTKFVASSLSDGRNIVLLPSGGYKDRGGTTDYGRVRSHLVELPGSFDRPNGEGPVNGDRFVLFQVDFPNPVTAMMIDIGAVRIDGNGADNALIAEYLDGGAWIQFGQRAMLTREKLSRRFAAGAPGHPGHTSKAFRVSLDANTGASGNVFFDYGAVQAELSALSIGLVRRYAPELGQPHQLVFTHGNIDVYEGGVWRSSVRIPIGQDILAAVKLEARYDTILMWHTNIKPQIVRRLGRSTEWACDDVVFQNVPLVDYGGVYNNGMTEIQEITIYDVGAGENFDLSLEGQTTTAILVDIQGGIAASRIQEALLALPNVSPGLLVEATESNNSFRVTFNGEGNANRDWPTMVGTALNADGYVRVRTTQHGKAGGEPIISDNRGWPAVGRYAQQRLIMAGLKANPNAILASVTGSPFDLNTEIDAAIAGFSYEIDNTENTQTHDIVVARTLLFIGDSQVVYLKTSALSKNEAPNFGTSDAPGIKNTVAAVMADNALYYVQSGGSSLRLMNYSAVEEDYLSDNASVLSAHLVIDPEDMARCRARGAVDSDQIFLVNANGTVTSLTMMKSQDVSGFAPWATDGSFRSVCVDHANHAWFLVVRPGFPQAELRLERQDPDKLLDEGTEIAMGAPATVIGGLERFNGRSVYAIANDSVYGPFTVAGGSIELGDPATAVRVGTWVAPSATDPEVSIEEETRRRGARLKRVPRVEISVLSTTSLAIAANGGPPVNVSLWDNADFITDTGPLARLKSGKIECEGMHGWTDHGKLTITQTFPGRLTVRRVTKDVIA